MTYIKRDNVPALSGEQVVELDTGELVAVCCDRKRVDAGLSYHSRARYIDGAGVTLRYPDGRPIATEFKLSLGVGRADELGDGVVVREMLFAVLGEPVTVFPWPESTLAAVSIRVSIAASAVCGPADAGDLL